MNHEMANDTQRILVFRQNGKAMAKTAGITRYGRGRFRVKAVEIEGPLPPVIEDGRDFLPEIDAIRADLVLDFLKHPDLSFDLAAACAALEIPVIASGKKIGIPGVMTPPT